MAKKRLIPKLLLKKGGYKNTQNVVVRTKNFLNPIQIGEVVSQAKIFQDQIADELVILRIDKNISFENLLQMTNAIADEVFMPITIGGNIDSEEKIKELLSNGADKVSINTEVHRNPNLLRKASHHFGSSTIVVSIDYKIESDGRAIVYSENGTNKTTKNLIEWAKEVERLGAGEILLSCIDRDGTRNGLDLKFASLVKTNVKTPIVLSGGCGLSSHFVEGFSKTGVSGISAGTFFALQDQNFIQTRSQILNAGINIRSK